MDDPTPFGPPPPGAAISYGGVLVDEKLRYLLREPRNYDGYVWTFAEGRPDPGETPAETALREVREETGYTATIMSPIEGWFRGGSLVTAYCEPDEFEISYSCRWRRTRVNELRQRRTMRLQERLHFE